jgi:hypothetical protein
MCVTPNGARSGARAAQTVGHNGSDEQLGSGSETNANSSCGSCSLKASMVPARSSSTSKRMRSSCESSSVTTNRRTTRPLASREAVVWPVRVWLDKPLGDRAVIDEDSDEELDLFTFSWDEDNNPLPDHGYRPANRRRQTKERGERRADSNPVVHQR